MSVHSYSRCWLHLTWATKDRLRLITPEIGKKLSKHLSEYSQSKQIYMRINAVQPEHVHALIDLPTSQTIEGVVKLLKGESSHWINESDLLKVKFAWGRGYGAFSVSHSHLKRVSDYIANQEEHHRRRSYLQEYERFVRLYGMEWHEE